MMLTIRAGHFDIEKPPSILKHPLIDSQVVRVPKPGKVSRLLPGMGVADGGKALASEARREANSRGRLDGRMELLSRGASRKRGAIAPASMVRRAQPMMPEVHGLAFGTRLGDAQDIPAGILKPSDPGSAGSGPDAQVILFHGQAAVKLMLRDAQPRRLPKHARCHWQS
jgi:hypothetical protein